MGKKKPGKGGSENRVAKKRSAKELQRRFEQRLSTIQDRVLGKMAGDTSLEDIYRHFSTIDIDVQATEVEWTSTFPDSASAHGVANLHWTRSWDYESGGRLEKALMRLIRACERLMRHVDSISIDLDEEEITVKSSFPDWSDYESMDADDEEEEEPEDRLELSRTVSLEKARWLPLRDEVRKIVEELHERMLFPDPEYDADRCMRCKLSDCCYDWRIHMTEAERRRIVEFLGEEDDAETYAKYFERDKDLSGYYRTVFRHVSEPDLGKAGETDGHCGFLKPGPDGSPRCSIYEVRPRVCREFDAGYCTEWSDLS
ncbi:MAG: hypothetical protein CSA62_04340 [Planctomycetota bacterium]|nr:MAG: hypothetical protein CSA62_04340 [Planctomycetota bacterium]